MSPSRDDSWPGREVDDKPEHGGRTGDRRLLQSVNNALFVLAAFSVQHPSWTLSELSRELGLSKSSAFRVMATLEANGFVRRNNETNQYSAGLKLWRIGCAAIASTGLRQVASEYLGKLVSETSHTAYCAVMDIPHVVHIDVHVPSSPIRLHANIGDRFLAHATSLGKVLLAFGDPADVETYIANHLVPFTSKTIADPDGLRAELNQIRRQGYALNRGEYQDLVRGVAAPVRDHSERVIAAIAVAGPYLQIVTDEEPLRLAMLIRSVAEEMSVALGASPVEHQPFMVRHRA